MDTLKTAVKSALIYGLAAAAGVVATNLSADGSNLLTVGEEAGVAAGVAAAKFVHDYLTGLKGS